ncbi:MAG: hypothetical protein QOG85_87 [Gaiellaceae bacterium]|jgi:uncharacterized membrane protein|nr:hypothetical protein [Gaiellaceae bacterium]
METPHTTEQPAERGLPSGLITAAVGLAVVIVALIFLFASNAIPSDWYGLFKFVHVLGAVVWVGGGATITILAMRAERSSDPREMATIARQAAFIGERVFAPVGLLVFLMGIAMVINLHWGFGTAWVTIALVGYVLTFLTGLLVLGPQSKRIAELMETKGPDAPETLAAVQRILLLARIDVGVLLIVVADMVLKPFT